MARVDRKSERVHGAKPSQRSALCGLAGGKQQVARGILAKDRVTKSESRQETGCRIRQRTRRAKGYARRRRRALLGPVTERAGPATGLECLIAPGLLLGMRCVKEPKRVRPTRPRG